MKKNLARVFSQLERELQFGERVRIRVRVAVGRVGFKKL